MVGIIEGISDTEKYAFVGNLVDNHSKHELARALFSCSVPGGPVMLRPYGIMIEDHGRYYAQAKGTDMIIGDRHIEVVKVTVPEFLHLLTEMVDQGGMSDMWPDKIRIEFHIAGWDSIPTKPVDGRTIPGDTPWSPGN